MATKNKSASRKSAGLSTAAIGRVASAAFNEGESFGTSVAAITSAFTPAILASVRRAPKVANETFARQYAGTRNGYMAGYMASRIPSNRTQDERISSAFLALDKAAPDAKSLKEGQGRRTEVEQTAYNNAKQAWSSRIKAANVPVPAAAGGGKRGKGKGKTTKAKEPSIVTLKRQASAALKFAPPAKVDRESAIDYLQRQAATMHAYVDKAQAKSGGSLPPAAVSAVQDFLTAMRSVK